MIKRYAAAAAILLGIGSTAHALEFQPIGAGSLGVGGAGVARNYGSLAPYWNPAGLAFAPKTVTVSLTAGVGIQPHGKLAQDLDDFNSAFNAWNADQTNQTKANTLADTANALLATTPNDNLRATAQAAVGAQIKHFGFGVYGTFEGGAIPSPSATLIPTPVNPATIQNDINTALNSKTVTVHGIALFEVPLSYGHAFDLGPAGKLALGASGKYLYAETSESTKQVFVNNSPLSSSDLTKDLNKNRKGSSNWGVDVGAIWRPVEVLSVGAVGKNLNQPSFDTEVPGNKITVDRQVRAGASITPLSWLEVTADVDVLSNTTLVPGLRTQSLGGGAEFHPFSCLKLRVGGYTDLVNSTSGAVTAGLSLGIPWVYLDLDGAYGLGTVRYKGTDYPTEAKVQFSTNFAF